MKHLLTIIFCAICAISYGQFSPTGTKTNFKNGIALGSKDSTAFNTNDSLAVTIDRNGRFMYRGLGAGAYWKVPQVGTDTVPDTRFVRLQQPTQFRQDGGFWISDTGRTSRLFRAAKFYGDTLQATTSGGGRILSNAGATVAEFGAGGGGNIDFHDFAGYNANRSASYTDRSFTDYRFVDSSTIHNQTGVNLSAQTAKFYITDTIKTDGVVTAGINVRTDSIRSVNLKLSGTITLNNANPIYLRGNTGAFSSAAVLNMTAADSIGVGNDQVGTIYSGSAPIKFKSGTNRIEMPNESGIIALNSVVLTTAAQPNITSLGTLDNLTVTGEVNIGNISVPAVSGGLLHKQNIFLTTGYGSTGVFAYGVSPTSHEYTALGTPSTPLPVTSGSNISSRGVSYYAPGGYYTPSLIAWQVIAVGTPSAQNHGTAIYNEVTPFGISAGDTSRIGSQVWHPDGSVTFSNKLFNTGGAFVPYDSNFALKIDLTARRYAATKGFLVQGNSSYSAGGVLGFNSTEQTEIHRQGSGGSSNYPGTTIPIQSKFLIRNGNQGQDGIVNIGNPIISIPGETATNIGLRVDSVGVRIDQIQNLQTQNSTYAFQVAGSVSASISSNAPVSFLKNNGTNETLNVWNAATSGDNYFIYFQTEAGGTGRGSIQYNRGSGLTMYNTTSDRRSKKILGKLNNSGELIDRILVHRAIMNGATIERPMFIADELQKVAPYAVAGEPNAVDKNGKPIYQQVDASSLIPLMLEEIKQLRKRVSILENKSLTKSKQ